MAKLSAHGVKFIYTTREEISVRFQVGNCKLSERDVDSLIALREHCKENPTTIIDTRGTENGNESPKT